ncbi:unnamed protein product [Didymodactylos carnosus]|nr:unnamed protein product [Didymodactylos carnosus]CAF3543128.1 unnamed protein product [Didymodactylos carnosus]
MIRDPIKRTVSNYYYSRRMCLKKNRCTFIKNRTILNYTLDDCIETENEPFKCITLEYGVTSAIPFFCGQNHLCSSNENLSWAVEKAKSNIDKYYTVVGLTENIEQLLFILEKLLPNYFRNISLVYIKKRRPHINFSPRKWRKELKPNTHLILKDLLKFEYDLYNYIKKRFHEQYKQLQLINKIHE